jgi:hypothetical protein
MSTDVIRTDQLAIEEFQNKLDMFQEAAEANSGGVHGMTPFNLQRIKVPSGEGRFWQVQALDKIHATEQLDGIIVMWRDTRVYWPKSQNDPSLDSKVPPACSSTDAIVGVGEPGGSCVPTGTNKEPCPFAKYHSDQKGGSGQACKAVRQLFLMRPDEEDSLLPDLICLPPTSVRPCIDYFNALTVRSQPSYAVVTRMGLEKRQNPAKKDYSVVAFTKLRDCTRPDLAKANAIRALLGRFGRAVILDPDAPKEQEG